MNFDGYSPHEITRFSSLVELDSPTNLPLGVAAVAQDVKFHLTSVRTRDGIQNDWGFTLPDNGAVTGLAGLKMGGPSGDLQVPLAFSALGHLYREFPAGSGQVVSLTGPLVTLPVNSSMQVASAFTKGFLAFGDLVNSTASPAVYNIGLDKLDPLSMRPVGDPWAPVTRYEVGEVVTPATPVGGTGHTFRAKTPGISGATQPAQFAALGGGSQTALATADSQSGGGTAWTNPAGVTDNDGVTFASVQVTPGAPLSQDLLAKTFNLAVPSGAVVTGIKVTGTAKQVGGTTGFLNLVLNGPSGALSNLQIIPTPNVATAFSLGGTNYVWGSTPPTDVQADDPTFGVVLTAGLADGSAQTPTIFLQNVVITIYYAVNPGALINDGTVVWQELTPVMSSSALAGNIAQGLRYLIVLFVNRNGYISGMSQASVVAQTIADSTHQLTASPIPTGPENTIARILAFTPAGQLGQLAGTGISSAGPYFWIQPAAQFFTGAGGTFNLSNVPQGVTVADVVSGVTMNSTLINDNVTTSATFNFTDDYLKATLNDVSSYFRKIKVPACSDVWYSKSLQRNFYAADTLPSGWYVSLQGDPESVFGDKGLIQVAENNGENRTAIREYGGIVYLMKERSGHVLTPSADDPSTWNVVEQWSGSGPCGPRAVDVCTNFMAYVHRSGLYVFSGGQPYCISKRIPVSWANVNWSAQATIWLLIDDETREIRIGVPTGSSTVPDKIYKCNYEESVALSDPIHFSPYIGKEIATGECYKWSIDLISANTAIRAERTLVNPTPNIDSATIQSQILFASSNEDGHVDPIIPMQFDDNGIGINSVYETVCPQDLMRPNSLGGVQADIGGYGQGSIEILALRAKDQKDGGVPVQEGTAPALSLGWVKKLAKPWIAGIPYSCGATGQNERFRMRISNNKQPGVWFDISYANIFARPVSSASPR